MIKVLWKHQFGVGNHLWDERSYPASHVLTMAQWSIFRCHAMFRGFSSHRWPWIPMDSLWEMKSFCERQSMFEWTLWNHLQEAYIHYIYNIVHYIYNTYVYIYIHVWSINIYIYTYVWCIYIYIVYIYLCIVYIYIFMYSIYIFKCSIYIYM